MYGFNSVIWEEAKRHVSEKSMSYVGIVRGGKRCWHRAGRWALLTGSGHRPGCKSGIGLLEAAASHF